MSALSETALAHHHAEEDLSADAMVLAMEPAPVEQEVGGVELRQAFCIQLQRTRERRGISREEIADATKISASLFAELERGDLSRWPAGIYRRAFFREYAHRIGLPADATVSEFVRLFPDEFEREPSQIALATGPLRLTLAAPLWRRLSPRHAQAAAVDTAVLVLGSGVVAWLSPVGLWTSLAVASLVYYSASTLLLGCSPAAWWIRRLHRDSKGITPCR